MRFTLLTKRELEAVTGGILLAEDQYGNVIGIRPFTPMTVRARDRYGNTMAVEDWMNAGMPFDFSAGNGGR